MIRVSTSAENTSAPSASPVLAAVAGLEEIKPFSLGCSTVLTQNSLFMKARFESLPASIVMFIDENGGRGRHVPFGEIEVRRVCRFS